MFSNDGLHGSTNCGIGCMFIFLKLGTVIKISKSNNYVEQNIKHKDRATGTY